jgi:sarcosine oxidase/L-pipecolate oxidase
MDRLTEKERQTGERWCKKADTLSHVQEGRLNGFIDTSAGFTYADKACTWARHLAENAGVKFILGPEVGKLDELSVEHRGGKKRVRGLRTMDGKEHEADVVVVAGGLFFLL